ncbi:MAG TPA: DUF1552 domain-containing protein, partial [Polyangiaceae bacterium]|nr:DUF1552 domain-containing protein [Polyangiaceae bacterium]
MSYKFARRSFLSSIGSTAMLLPLLQSIEARAQGLPGPKRLLVILKPVGVVRADYLPSGTPTPEGITSFDWRPISSHFEPLRSRLVLIDGLAHKSESTSPNAAGERNGGNETHEGGIPAMMCGVPCVGRIGTQDHVAGGASIDQIFLKRSPFLGGAASTVKTPYGS